jgi:5'-3' exonuclease
MIIIDYNAIAIGNVVTQKLDPDENLIRHMILNSIRMYRKKFNKEYGEIVITSDAGNNWRYKAFPQYKASRKKHRSDSKMDWNEIFRITNMVYEELGENFPYKTLKVDGCEADDIIAALVYNTQEFGQYEKVMIVSADKDFGQLQKFSNVAQFSPMTKKYIKIEHPRKQLLELILRGDTSDGVPNVLSDDNVFVEERRQNPLTAKKMEAIIADLEEDELLYAADWYRNYQRNKQLIDLSETPTVLKEEIINTYMQQDRQENKSKVLNYLVKNRCRRLIDDIGDFI